MLIEGTMSFFLVFFLNEDQIISGLLRPWGPQLSVNPYLRRTVNLLPFLLPFLRSLFFAK